MVHFWKYTTIVRTKPHLTVKSCGKQINKYLIYHNSRYLIWQNIRNEGANAVVLVLGPHLPAPAAVMSGNEVCHQSYQSLYKIVNPLGTCSWQTQACIKISGTPQQTAQSMVSSLELRAQHRSLSRAVEVVGIRVLIIIDCLDNSWIVYNPFSW